MDSPDDIAPRSRGRWHLMQFDHPVHGRQGCGVVGQQQRGPAAQPWFQTGGDRCGGRLVQPGQRFVKHDHERIAQHDAGERQTPRLTAGETNTVFPHPGIETLIEALDEIRKGRHFECVPEGAVIRVGTREKEIGGDRVGEYLAVLCGITHTLMDSRLRQCRQLRTAQPDLATQRVEQTHGEIGQGRFAAARRAHDGDVLALGEAQ